MNKNKISLMKLNHPSPNQELYHPIFQVGKAWPSGLERRLKKYGWFSSGHTKQISDPETDHILTPELNRHSIHGRRSRALAQALPTLNGRWYSSSQKSAFTIIEVVLVLAIAGLIFLMVFIALPALQRNQRDTQRKNDISKLKVAISNYRANNGPASFPFPNNSIMNFDESTFGRNYLKADQGEFQDPNGSQYQLRYSHTREDGTRVPGWNIASTAHHYPNAIYLTTGLKCAGESVAYAESRYNFTIHIALEGGGVYCVDG